jgi:spoIIIJ-associated protein
MTGEGTAGPEPVEATGETVGEAKWAALRALERLYPGLEKEDVRFTVVSEGERGLLGVGHVPAKVIAVLDGPIPAPPARVAPPADEEPGSPPARLRGFLERVCTALDLPAVVAVAEHEDRILATLGGSDLGIVIGKRGQTLDAIQYLANAVVYASGDLADERKPIVVDAAGYRSRRQAALERDAERAARDAIRTASAVELEPMSAVERKIVHVYLQELGGVETSSEGTEPNRRVVVRPLRSS